MSEAEQLEKLCQPVVDWLKKNHDPHTEVRISEDRIDLVESVIGIPVGKDAATSYDNKGDDAQSRKRVQAGCHMI